MSNKLIYDRENLYVMILLFKKEQKEKKLVVLEPFFLSFIIIYLCVYIVTLTLKQLQLCWYEQTSTLYSVHSVEPFLSKHGWTLSHCKGKGYAALPYKMFTSPQNNQQVEQVLHFTAYFAANLTFNNSLNFIFFMFESLQLLWGVVDLYDGGSFENKQLFAL